MAEPADDFDRGSLLPERLASHLRKRIVAGEFAPGQRLVEQELARRFDVSRVPLREAFRILAAEGLVVISAHRGAAVAELSSVELVELFAVRAALEGLAAEQAASREPPPDLETMRSAIADMRRAVSASDLEAYYALAARFHDLLLAASGNSVLVRTWDQIRMQLRRYQAAMSRLPELPARSIREHERIVKAIRERDGESARRSAQEHIANVVRQLTKESSDARARLA